MSTEKVVKEFVLYIRSGKKLELVSDYLAPKVMAHQVVSGEAQRIERSPENYCEHIKEFLQSFGDFDLVIEAFLVQGDKAYVRWRQEGRHMGNIMGYSPTGLPLTSVDSAVYRVSDGKIVEYWIQQEVQGLREQLRKGAKNEKVL